MPNPLFPWLPTASLSSFMHFRQRLPPTLHISNSAASSSSIASSSKNYHLQVQKMDGKGLYQSELNLKETELRLGLPGRDENEKGKESPSGFRNNKRVLSESSQICGSAEDSDQNESFSKEIAPPSKAQIVGWPPIRSYRKNCLLPKKSEAESEKGGIYVKVSMDGAPYLRKIDLRVYGGYPELLKALEGMFKITVGEYSEREGYRGSKHSPTYEDKDGDWMLVGDVPWEIFMTSCKRLRIMKGTEARGGN